MNRDQRRDISGAMASVMAGQVGDILLGGKRCFATLARKDGRWVVQLLDCGTITSMEVDLDEASVLGQYLSDETLGAIDDGFRRLAASES